MATLKLNSQTVVTESSGTLTAPALNLTTGTMASGVTFPTGHIVQTVIDSDTTTYANTSVGDDSGVSNGPVALSKAYSITPTSSSNKILAHFMIPQVRINLDKSGLYMRVYRKIGSGSYAELTEASGDSSGTPKGSVFGNHDKNGDGNRISTIMTGHFTDQTHAQSGVEVSYKFYFGCGDSGTHAIYVNRTENDNSATYNFRTRTHCTLQEIKG
tara:strand:- start:790 stop:1431 length:642 start_codon:yes stop_codon:yes gene_type:complete